MHLAEEDEFISKAAQAEIKAGLPHIGAAVGREPWSNPQGSLFFSRVGGDSTTSA